jgi:glutathione S-transferase
MSAPAERPILLTFAPMVDSETSRLVLAHHGIGYEERDHLFGLVSLLTLLHGGYGRVPLLYGAGPRMSGPRPIADHFDALAAPDGRLVPTDRLAAQVEADWAAYNGQLGGDVAVFAYFHLLPGRAAMAPIFAAPVPPREARLTPAAYPFLRFLFTALLRLSPARAESARARIRALFDATDRRIADGRPYLCGDRLTLGDIALAAASAPLLLPQGYGAAMPALAAMPPAMAQMVEALRGHPTAAFVQRLYSQGFSAARTGRDLPGSRPIVH